MADSNQLSLDFTRQADGDLRHADNTHALPLRFGKPDTPPQPPKPPKPKVYTAIGACHTGIMPAGAAVSVCLNAGANSVPLRQCADIAMPPPTKVAGCLVLDLGKAQPGVSGCLNLPYPAAVAVAGCASASSAPSPALYGCGRGGYTAGVHLAACTAPSTPAAPAFTGCHGGRWTGSRTLDFCRHGGYAGRGIGECRSSRYTPAAPVPCEWYEIVVPDNDPNRNRPCGPKPKGNVVPLRFSRHKKRLDARKIPLPFSCNPDFAHVPPLDSYIMLNKIKAKIITDQGETAIDPISARLSADMGGYYWTGEATLPPDDFAKLNMHAVKHGQEPLIEIDINGTRFRFLAENHSDNRRFGQYSYTVSGRSITARLGADYAGATAVRWKTGINDRDLYVSQIANAAVQDLGVEVHLEMEDWLVPAGAYSLADKTPVAVLADIAEAGGGFVYSDPAEAKIYIKPRWREPAWHIHKTSPQLAVPANTILSISGQKQTETQADAVFVYGANDKGAAAKVIREGASGDTLAATLTHPLITHLIPCRTAGIAALCETGVHKSESVRLPHLPKHGLDFAEVGRIWQFAEQNGAWNARITGISIEAQNNSGAVTVYQTVAADRYLGS